MSRNQLKGIYGVVLPVITMIALVMTCLAAAKILGLAPQAFDRLAVVTQEAKNRPVKQKLRPGQISRDIDLLGIYRPAPGSEPGVIAKHKQTQRVGFFRPGQQIFGGPRILRIHGKQVLFASGTRDRAIQVRRSFP